MGSPCRLHAVAALIVCVALFGCRSPRGESQIKPGTYYTQFALQLEHDTYQTINYRRGVLLPINTEVTLVSSGDKDIVVRIEPEGRQFTVKHNARDTHDTLDQAFAKLFALEPVDLSRFTELERKSIAAGRVAIGISKKAVLAAMGPPPASATTSLASLKWRYWNKDYASFSVWFDKHGQVIDASH